MSGIQKVLNFVGGIFPRDFTKQADSPWAIAGTWRLTSGSRLHLVEIRKGASSRSANPQFGGPMAAAGHAQPRKCFFGENGQ
jgi:hypothetical protein